MENENQKTEAKYDAKANQRYEFEVSENGEKFDTAHIIKPLTEERYLEYLKSVKVEDGEAETVENVKQKSAELWDDLITEVEDFELKESETLQTAVAVDEKIEVVSNFLAVAIVKTEKKANRKRSSNQKEELAITSEAYFNGLPVQQSHKLKARSDEWQVKFDRIQRKRFKKEITEGLRREPKIEYVPQDEKIGELYDEMLIESTGFENNETPLRFKTAVIYEVFKSKFNSEKK